MEDAENPPEPIDQTSTRVNAHKRLLSRLGQSKPAD